jgi:pimeloyl-ACP methyl ester carboxylesterase
LWVFLSTALLPCQQEFQSYSVCFFFFTVQCSASYADWVEHEPGGTSVYNMAHWAQMIRANRPMQMYDFGPLENIRRYNKTSPPCYTLEKISTTLPILLINGTTDTLADPQDVEWLKRKLSKQDVECIQAKGFNHTDLVWCEDLPKLIFPSLMQFVQQHTPTLASSIVDLSDSWQEPIKS